MKKTFFQKQITLQATGSEEKIFYQLDEKNLLYLPLQDALDHFIFLYFSTACLRRRLPYIIKNDGTYLRK